MTQANGVTARAMGAVRAAARAERMDDALGSDVWRRALAFHGHECRGLAMGVKAVEGALAELGLGCDPMAVSDELTCVAESMTCAVDAVQALLGLTFGRHGIVVRPRGKMAFTFYDRTTGGSVRLCAKARMPVAASIAELLLMPYDELFAVTEPRGPVPSLPPKPGRERCAACGEPTDEDMLRVRSGELLCLDCCAEGDRRR